MFHVKHFGKIVFALCGQHKSDGLLIDAARMQPNFAVALAGKRKIMRDQDQGRAALAVHLATNGPIHSWTKDSAAADALEALARAEEAAALRALWA